MINIIIIIILCTGVIQGFAAYFTRTRILNGCIPRYTISRDSSIKDLTLAQHISKSALHVVPLSMIVWLYTREVSLFNLFIILFSVYITIISYYNTVLEYKEFTKEILNLDTNDYIEVVDRVNKFCDTRVYEGDSIYHVIRYKENIMCQLINQR